MDIGQLMHFKKLATLEHLTKAAEELFISQSTLSVSISRLESELGVSLFDRVGRKLRLNSYGEAFLPEVDAALAHIKKGTSLLKTMLDNEQNSVRFITPTLLGFPNLLSEIENVCRNITILTSSCPLDMITPKIVSGEVDFCISGFDLLEPSLDSYILKEQELGFVVAATHPLASRGTVTVDELKNEHYATSPPGSGHRHVLSTLFKKNGLSPKVLFESDSYYDIMRAVSSGYCIAVLVDTIYHNYNTGTTVFLHIADSKIDVNLRLYRVKAQKGKEERPVVKAVREVINDYFLGRSPEKTKKIENAENFENSENAENSENKF